MTRLLSTSIIQRRFDLRFQPSFDVGAWRLFDVGKRRRFDVDSICVFNVHRPYFHVVFTSDCDVVETTSFIDVETASFVDVETMSFIDVETTSFIDVETTSIIKRRFDLCFQPSIDVVSVLETDVISTLKRRRLDLSDWIHQIQYTAKELLWNYCFGFVDGTVRQICRTSEKSCLQWLFWCRHDSENANAIIYTCMCVICLGCKIYSYLIISIKYSEDGISFLNRLYSKKELF